MTDDIYTVHSAVVEQSMVPVTLEGGGKVMGQVPCVVVELVSKGIHGSVLRRYVPESNEDRENLLKKYQVGAEVKLSSEVVSEGQGYPEDHRKRPLGAAQPLHVTEEESPPPEQPPASRK